MRKYPQKPPDESKFLEKKKNQGEPEEDKFYNVYDNNKLKINMVEYLKIIEQTQKSIIEQNNKTVANMLKCLDNFKEIITCEHDSEDENKQDDDNEHGNDIEGNSSRYKYVKVLKQSSKDNLPHKKKKQQCCVPSFG